MYGFQKSGSCTENIHNDNNLINASPSLAPLVAPPPRAQTISTLALSEGGSGIAAKAMAVTTISGASGALTNALARKRSVGYWDSVAANHGLLAGLVGITAGCSTVEPEGALVIGIVAGFVYAFSSRLMLRLKVGVFGCC